MHTCECVLTRASIACSLSHLACQQALDHVGPIQAVDAVDAGHALLLAHDPTARMQEVSITGHVGGDLTTGNRDRGGGGSEI